MPQQLINAIRDIPDFPSPGIIFKDITPILGDHKLLQHSIDLLLETVKGEKIDKVVGIDARGFIFGAPLALALGAGFVPVRKKGKLPYDTYAQDYSLEYGENCVEIHQDAINPGDKVLLVDDLLATGGTAAAAVQLLEKLNADIVAVSFLIELNFLNGRKLINHNNIHSIVTY